MQRTIKTAPARWLVEAIDKDGKPCKPCGAFCMLGRFTLKRKESFVAEIEAANDCEVTELCKLQDWFTDWNGRAVRGDFASGTYFSYWIKNMDGDWFETRRANRTR